MVNEHIGLSFICWIIGVIFFLSAIFDWRFFVHIRYIDNSRIGHLFCRALVGILGVVFIILGFVFIFIL